MDDGRVAEVGAHADLLEAGGAYARLWAAFTGETPPDQQLATTATD
jgi:ATP-binding cassette subfamily B protein